MVWLLTSEDEESAIRELNDSSPRAKAIVGATVLENRLTYALSPLFPINGETKKNLFKDTGPLGNFDTKSKVAYAIGIISKAALQDITKVVEIRNKFAHRLGISDFHHKDIRPIAMGLGLIETHVRPLGEPDEIAKDIKLRLFEADREAHFADPERRYLLTIRLIILGLHQFPVGGPKPPPPQPLI